MRTRVTFLLLIVTVSWGLSPPLPKPDEALIKDYRLALEAIFGVGIRLQAFLQDDNSENFLVSPISAAVLLGQLVLGAEGDFRKELVKLLALPESHHENDVLLFYGKKKNESFVLPYSTLHLQMSYLVKTLESENKGFVLRAKNALFLNKDIKLIESFEKGLKTLYDTGIFGVDFSGNPSETQRVINSWATNSTNGLIKTILPAPPAPTTSSVFTNAIYFQADWEIPFSDTLNRPGFFNTTANNTVPVTYMVNQLDQIFYAESQDYRMIGLPYKNEELGMYIILPRPENPLRYDMKAFIQKLKSLEILDTISRGKRRDVVVKLPKMSLKHTFSILDQLKKYKSFKKQNIRVNATNVVDKLEDKVDAFTNFTAKEEEDVFLTNAAVGTNLKIGDIVQQVVITVNEKGTEAAAISASTIDYMGGVKNFLVERPFIFFIRHEATTATLFWGTVSNPVA